MRYDTILFILADCSKRSVSRICEQQMYERKSRNFYLAAARPNNARAARSMTETFLNRLSIADGCPLSPHKRRKRGHFLTAALCHRTKSLRDSGGMWLVRGVFPTVEIVGNRCCLENRGIDPQRACCATPNWT